MKTHARYDLVLPPSVSSGRPVFLEDRTEKPTHWDSSNTTKTRCGRDWWHGNLIIVPFLYGCEHMVQCGTCKSLKPKRKLPSREELEKFSERIIRKYIPPRGFMSEELG